MSGCLPLTADLLWICRLIWNDTDDWFDFPPQSFPGAQAAPRIQADLSLPSIKKLAPPESKVKERLFVVFSPSPLSLDVLEDVFW